MISTQASHYYTLLEALNKNTEEMSKSHNVNILKYSLTTKKKNFVCFYIKNYVLTSF